MATTNTQIKEVGGLNHAEDYLLFRFANVGELNAALDNARAVAAAWVKIRTGSAVYGSADPDIQTTLALGEAYLALHFLVPAIKARKVFGTHYAYDSEDSERYAELIDTEWLTLARELLEPILTVETAGTEFAKPAFRVGEPVDTTLTGTLESADEEVAEVVDRARGMTVPR